MSQEFKPNYAVPPGETLQEILDEKGISLNVFSESVDIPFEVLLDVMDAKKQINEKIANEFEKALEIPSKFWLNLQKNYEKTIQRLETEGKALQREQGGRVTVIE